MMTTCDRLDLVTLHLGSPWTLNYIIIVLYNLCLFIYSAWELHKSMVTCRYLMTSQQRQGHGSLGKVVSRFTFFLPYAFTFFLLTKNEGNMWYGGDDNNKRQNYFGHTRPEVFS